MTFRVLFTPEAEDQLAALCLYIAQAASPVPAGKTANRPG